MSESEKERENNLKLKTQDVCQMLQFYYFQLQTGIFIYIIYFQLV